MDDTPSKAARPSRRFRTILVLSLGLNLLVFGLVVGMALSGRSGGPPRGFDFGLGPVARALDHTDRRAIGSALRRDGGLRAAGVREGAAAMIAALRKVPFDPQNLQTALDRQNILALALQSKAQMVLLDRISAMDPDTRAAFADRLEQEFRRRPGRGKGGGSGG